ncbi:DUF402 domain-containing protein [Butyrivibrio sp. MC2013]|uniref:DUF402 domain-containing protein n=1 Tax=Butyrivibrio sp. MC2013 TaxID=1280686 RepID=UPI000405FD0D|nr:DUF402 domain-containing protein [Butyrivibrio sp. MC2013]
MNAPALYRKRLIPSECIALKDDRILCCNDDHIITSWKAFSSKSYLSKGYSCYYLHEGIKLSKFLKEDGSFSRWYFDIVSYEWSASKDSLTVVDLLADVIIFPDNSMRVMDLDELAKAIEDDLISKKQTIHCLVCLDSLLRMLRKKGINVLARPIEEAIAAEKGKNSDQ